MKKFAVIGHPIGHTMSPFIHKRLFELSGISMEYSVLDVENLEKSMPSLKNLDGFNITIPHKLGIIQFLDELTYKAKLFGSVNTVKVSDGKLYGETTDGIGCRKALINHSCDFGGNTLILGNGGAARAVAFEGAPLGGSISFAVRNKEKSKTLVDEIKRYSPALEINLYSFSELEEIDITFDLLINCTSLGMTPNIDAQPVSDNVVARCRNIFDAVYNPNKTKLIMAGERLGKNCVLGIEMLVWQAVEAHSFWYGGEFNKSDIDKLALDSVKEMERIFGN